MRNIYGLFNKIYSALVLIAKTVDVILKDQNVKNVSIENEVKKILGIEDKN